MRISISKRKKMTPSVLIKIITNDGTKIYLTVEQARELRDFLMTEQSITPVAAKP